VTEKTPLTRQVIERTKANLILNAPTLILSGVQETAMNLYDLGMNVFPVPYGQKSGYPWRMMQYARLNPEDIYSLFRDQCNLAVMAGRTSGNLFVIDCETRTTFEYHETLLKDANIPIWAVRSGGSRGGGHLYLKCRDGEVKGVKAGDRKDYEVRGNRCYVLAPPSLHPTSRRLYQWHERETPEPPTVSLDQVNWLALTLTKDTPKNPKTPQPYAELSSSTRDFIFTGAEDGERNNRLFSAACDMAGNDFDHNTAIQLLLPSAQRSGLSKRETHDTINSAYSQARTPAKSTARKKKTPRPHEKALAWIQEQKWQGKRGQTDRAVLLACCERACTANEKGVFRASSREIAELARVTRTTASIALKRLREAKVLVFAGCCQLTGANLYRFGTKPQKEGAENCRNRDTVPIPVGVDSVTILSKTDAVEQQALGKTAHTLYMVLMGLKQPYPVKRLAESAKLSARQVYRALERLKKYGLVNKVGGGYVAIALNRQQLDEQVAKPAGTLGRGDERRQLHQRERGTIAAGRLYKARWPSGYEQSVERVKPKRWRCPNCGQVWSMADLEPPAVCDFCGDCVTWKLL
jgi:rubrerythrin